VRACARPALNVRQSGQLVANKRLFARPVRCACAVVRLASRARASAFSITQVLLVLARRRGHLRRTVCRNAKPALQRTSAAHRLRAHAFFACRGLDSIVTRERHFNLTSCRLNIVHNKTNILRFLDRHFLVDAISNLRVVIGVPRAPAALHPLKERVRPRLVQPSRNFSNCAPLTVGVHVRLSLVVYNRVACNVDSHRLTRAQLRRNDSAILVRINAVLEKVVRFFGVDQLVKLAFACQNAPPRMHQKPFCAALCAPHDWPISCVLHHTDQTIRTCSRLWRGASLCTIARLAAANADSAHFPVAHRELVCFRARHRLHALAVKQVQIVLADAAVAVVSCMATLAVVVKVAVVSS